METANYIIKRTDSGNKDCEITLTISYNYVSGCSGVCEGTDQEDYIDFINITDSEDNNINLTGNEIDDIINKICKKK